jgi:putative membrane fusion protein
MNKTVFNSLKWIAVLFVSVYVIMQFYSSVVNPVTTDTVYPHSSISGCDTKGFVIRNETLVEKSIDGTLGYEVENGGRVAKNGVIANIYSSDLDAEKKAKAEQINQQISVLEDLQNYNDLNAADLSLINSKIHTAFINTLDATQGGKVTGSGNEDVLLQYINRRQIVTGQTSGFQTLIASLKAERESLSGMNVTPISTLTSPQSGYVIYSVDGYENKFSTENLKEITAESLSGLEPETGVSAVCKIVSDYEWYIAAAVPFDQSLNLREGQSVTLKTALKSAKELTATVKYINKQSNEAKAVVIFSCNIMNTELASVRNLDITIVYKEFKGLRVDNRAVRVVDGQKGVYVLIASQVKFVPVNILWQGENYSVVEQQASDSKVLRIYDEIIVKGKNLHDGKVIR